MWAGNASWRVAAGLLGGRLDGHSRLAVGRGRVGMPNTLPGGILMLMLEGSDALTIAVAREGLPKLDRYGGPKAVSGVVVGSNCRYRG